MKKTSGERRLAVQRRKFPHIGIYAGYGSDGFNSQGKYVMHPQSLAAEILGQFNAERQRTLPTSKGGGA